MDKNIDVRVLVLSSEYDQILLVLEREKLETFADGTKFLKPSKRGMPGGRGEPGDEDEIATGKRETEEETNIWPDINPRTRVEERRKTHLKVGFVGYYVAGRVKVNSDEILECGWFPVGVLWDPKFNMYSGHRRMAQELLKKTKR